MGGGTSKAGSGAIDKAIAKATADIDIKKAGVKYGRLPKAFQDNINNNLKPSDAVQGLWREGNRSNATDEWTVGISGVNERRKVITGYNGGKVEYTVKNKNKVDLKTNDKYRVVNYVSDFYDKWLRYR